MYTIVYSRMYFLYSVGGAMLSTPGRVYVGPESPTLRPTKRQLLCSCFLENNVEEGADPVISKFHMKVS